MVDAQQRIHVSERNEMIVVTFFSSAAISALYLLAIQKKQALQAFQMGRKVWGFAIGSSLGAAFAVYTLMILLAYIPSYILYTVNNGSILVVSALLCAVVLKERMTKMTMTGIALSVLSIILLSI